MPEGHLVWIFLLHLGCSFDCYDSAVMVVGLVVGIAAGGYWQVVARVFGFAGFGEEGLSFSVGLEVAQVT